MNLIPTVIETTNRGERAYDIYSRLLKDRIIMLGSAIDDNVANSIVSQLLFLQAQDSEKDIYLYINSPGQATEIEIAANHILKTREKLNRILAERTGQSIERIQKDTDRDNFLTADEAKEYGLIDHVMQPEDM